MTMLKKFNWGHGIFLFYTVFVCVLATALIASRGVDHSLVVEDYYAQDLAYQKTYDKTQNNLATDKVKVTYDAAFDVLYLGLSAEESVTGTVQFYRPSDKSQDFTLELTESNKTINTADLSRGHWILKIDWTEGNTGYYSEQEVTL